MDFDTTRVDRIIESIGTSAKATIPILQAIQKEYRYIPLGVFDYVSKRIGVPAAQLQKQLRLQHVQLTHPMPRQLADHLHSNETN